MPIVLALIALLSLMDSPQAQTPAGLGQMVSPETWDETVKSFKGRPTLVTFWEVACEPCLEEMPGLIEVSRELAPKGLQVCEVNTDPQARFEAAVRLLDKLQVPFQRYYKKPGSDVRFRQIIDPEYGANPFAVLYGPGGNKLQTFPDAHTKAEWLSLLAPHLDRGPPQPQTAEPLPELSSPEAAKEAASSAQGAPEDPFALLNLPGAAPLLGASSTGSSQGGPPRSPFKLKDLVWASSSPASGTLTLQVTSDQESHLLLSTLTTEKIRGKGLHSGKTKVSKLEHYFMEIRGETEEILRTPGLLFIPLTWVEGTESVKAFDVRLTFSGCTDGPKGMCYPPESYSLSGSLSKSGQRIEAKDLQIRWLNPREPWPVPEDQPATASIAQNELGVSASASTESVTELSKKAFKDSSFFEKVFAQSLLWAFLLSFLGGILTSFTPCVYPMIPATVAIFGAKSVRSRWAACSLAGTYILGVALSYASLGVLAAAVGTVFGTLMENPYVISVVAAFYVILALSMLDVFVFYLPSSWVSAASMVNREGYAGAFLMGLVSSIVFAPCGEPILLGILTFVAKTQSFFFGFWLLFVYAWGIGVLFFVIAAFSSAILYLPKAGSWMVGVKDFFGLLLLGMALYWLQYVLPPVWLWGLATAYFLGVATFIHTKNQGLEGWPRTVLSFTTLALLLAGTLPLNRFAALHGWLPPAAPHVAAVSGEVPTAPQTIAWQTGTPLTDLANARAMGKPAIVDYRTNVCPKCDELEHHVFSHPAVRKALSGFVTIQVNLSEAGRNQEIQDLRLRQGIYAVPVIEFYDSSGNLLQHKRIADVMAPEEFLEHIRDIG